MSKIAIIYKSKQGHSEQYAKWLKEAVEADLFEVSKVKAENLLAYDLIVLGSGVYLGKIEIAGFIKANFNILKYKKVIIFAVGAYSIKAENLRSLEEKNFSDDMQKEIKIFQLRAGIDRKKISLNDKFTISCEKKKIEKKTDRTNDEIMMLGIFDGLTDFTKKENLNEMVDYINKGKWKLQK
ncbi:MAG: flavodoxin domain-containing protein [Oscillospiraceae bacterium]